MAAVNVTNAPIKRVAIVGGGIGGLVLAHLLRASPSLSVMVYERDTTPEARAQGYYIGLQGAGLKVVKERLVSLAPSLAPIISDPNLALHGFAVLTSGFYTMMRMLAKIPAFESTLVPRWGFRASLAQDLPSGVILWNKRVDRYEERADEVVIYFKDGTQATADLLVGADGVRSAVRAQRMPSLQVKEVGVANFGGRLPLDEALAAMIAPWDRLLIRVLGREGHSLLMMRFATPDGRPMVLWSLSWPVTPADQAVQAEWRAIKARSGRDDDPDAYSPDECAFLAAQQTAVLKRAEAHFGERRVADMVRRTPVAALFAPQTVKSMETPPPPAAYAAPSRVFLLGDAAHAMTTHRGLGANTAIEDAADLADHLLAPAGATVSSLPALQAKVFTRGFAAVAGSLQSTRAIHAKGWAATLRNTFIWVIGTFFLPPMMFIMSVKARFTCTSGAKNK